MTTELTPTDIKVLKNPRKWITDNIVQVEVDWMNEYCAKAFGLPAVPSLPQPASTSIPSIISIPSIPTTRSVGDIGGEEEGNRPAGRPQTTSQRFFRWTAGTAGWTLQRFVFVAGRVRRVRQGERPRPRCSYPYVLRRHDTSAPGVASVPPIRIEGLV